MKNKHLTDEEIQNYALDAGHCSESSAAHIQQCGHCRQQVRYYERLIEGIKTQPKELFNFDLSALVMEQLSQSRPAYDTPLGYIMAVLMVMMAGVVGYTFGNSLVGLFMLVQPLLIALVIITALGLMVFLGADMYNRYKAQMKSLSIY
jgi:hypothetical protein